MTKYLKHSKHFTTIDATLPNNLHHEFALNIFYFLHRSYCISIGYGVPERHAFDDGVQPVGTAPWV